MLPVVLAVALAVRVWGIDFGLPYVNARPDEAQAAGSAVGFLTGNLRPPQLEWGTLFPYVVALIYLAYFAVTRPFAGYATLAAFAESRRADIRPFIFVTRGLSALMGVVTVWGVYRIGRRAFDETVGIVASSFLALCFLHVRDSHFGVTDVTMTALVVLAVLAILRWRQTGEPRHAAVAGLVAGLAVSTKYNAIGVCVPFAVALVQRFVEERRVRPGTLERAAQAAALFAGALAVALFGTSPYILIDWSRFVRAVAVTQSMVTHGHGMAVGQGWWYFARVVLPAAVGWPIFIAGIAGAVVLLARRPRESAVVLAFPIAYYVVAGAGLGVFARYILPVVPFLCLSAAWLIVSLARTMVGGRSPAVRRAVLVVVTVVADRADCLQDPAARIACWQPPTTARSPDAPFWESSSRTASSISPAKPMVTCRWRWKAGRPGFAWRGPTSRPGGSSRRPGLDPGAAIAARSLQRGAAMAGACDS